MGKHKTGQKNDEKKKKIQSTKLTATNSQSDTILANFSYIADLTERSFKRWLIRGTAQWTLLFGFSLVNRQESPGTQSERIVLIVGHWHFIVTALIARLQDLSSLINKEMNH